jgi:uncharacterized metal-binding protein YceD (DUF177 family)
MAVRLEKMLLVVVALVVAAQGFVPIDSHSRTAGPWCPPPLLLPGGGGGGGGGGGNRCGGGATTLWARGKGQKERARLRENPEGAGIPENEFSRPFSSEVLGKGKSMTLEAKPAELAALSKRFGVQEIPALEATVSTQQRKGLRHCVFLEGRISGEVVQACAISGSSVPSTIEVDFECVLLEEGGANAAAALAEEGDYDVEELVGGKADLGEIIAQYFALEIDTYPTAPDATLPVTDGGGK